MENIIRFMQDRYTLNVSVYDESFLERTIASRMIFSSCCSTKDYLNLMVKNPSEVTSLIDSLTNSYSEFFRNSLTFAILKQIIYPKIFDKKKSLHVPEVRIWSAGCAAGQESYSLAMLADDFITEKKIIEFKDSSRKEDKNLSKFNEEINLLYVAITRTKNSIHIPETLMPFDFPRSVQIHIEKVEKGEKKDEKLNVKTERKHILKSDLKKGKIK